MDFLVLDMLMVSVAYVLAVHVRMQLEIDYIFVWQSVLEVQWIAILLIYAVSALATSAYTNIIRRDKGLEFRAVFKQILLTFAIFTIYLYMVQLSFDFSRLIFGFTAVFSLFAVYAERLVWKNFVRRRILKKNNLPQMILIGTSNRVPEVIREFKARPYDLFHIMGVIITDKDMTGETIENIPVVSDVDHYKEFLLSNVVDEAYLSLGSGKLQNDIVDYLLEMGIVAHICLLMNTEHLPNRMQESLGGHMVVTTSNQVTSVFQLWLKRIIDIVGAIVGLIITGILYIIVAPQIKKAEPGPVFFAQDRVGKNGRVFKLYKFRSMYTDAEERKQALLDQNELTGAIFKIEDDPRILPGIGDKIRRSSIDEFPQFLNVLKGDMSLVGTRPPTLDEFSSYDAHHKMRLSFKPGITGMWQVSGRNNITDFEEVVRLDNEYIKEWSIWLDIRILLKTVAVVLRKEGAQ